MTSTFDIETRVAEVAKSYYQLIKNADGQTLRQLAKERVIGIQISAAGEAIVCVVRGDRKSGEEKYDGFESRIETPIHFLPVRHPYGKFSMQGCQEWLDSYGLDDCDILALGKSFKGAALERRVEGRLFSHLGVILALKGEMLEELGDLMDDYSSMIKSDVMDDVEQLALD